MILLVVLVVGLVALMRGSAAGWLLAALWLAGESAEWAWRRHRMPYG